MRMAVAIGAEGPAELVAHAGHGDRDALRELAMLHGPAMHRFAWRMLLDSDEADQVVHGVFARLAATAARWRGSDDDVRLWFYRTCTNLCLDRLRRREAPEPDRADGATACLARLGGRSRAAILLTRCEALANADTADLLGMRLTAFEWLLSEARTALQACARRTSARPDPLNQLLQQVRPPPLPTDFADRIVDGAAAAPRSRAKESHGARGAWIRRQAPIAGLLIAGLLIAGMVAMATGDGRSTGQQPVAMPIAPPQHVSPQPSTVASVPAKPSTMHMAAPSGPNATEQAEPRRVALTERPQGPAVRRKGTPARLASASALPRESKATQRRKRPPAPPIPLLPKGFASLPSAASQSPGDPAPAQGAQSGTAPSAYAQWAAERRERMRSYLRTLSPDELRQLREEERVVRREHRENKRRGLAQLSPEPQ